MLLLLNQRNPHFASIQTSNDDIDIHFMFLQRLMVLVKSSYVLVYGENTEYLIYFARRNT